MPHAFSINLKKIKYKKKKIVPGCGPARPAASLQRIIILTQRKKLLGEAKMQGLQGPPRQCQCALILRLSLGKCGVAF